MRSRINYYFFLFATHLSHRAYSLTIFCKRDTYTRSDPIVMDRERNFSRDRQTSEKCTFSFFKKRKNSSSARFQEIFSVSREICGTRAIRYRGDFCTDGYLPCLASVPNTVGLITGKIGSPIYFFFRGTFYAPASTLLFRSGARWLRKRSRSRSRTACRRHFMRDVFKVCSSTMYFARIKTNGISERKPLYTAAIE